MTGSTIPGGDGRAVSGVRRLFLWVLAALGLALVGEAARVQAQVASTTVTVNGGANRHAIDPRIYGIAYGTTSVLSDLNVPLNRYGGNNASRYNWQQNADNRGSDWYFESIPDSSATAGERGDTAVTSSRAAGAEAMLTVPMVGWVAKLGSNRSKLASFSVAKYGSQQQTDPFWSDAGNGVKSAGGNVTGNAPGDASVAADSTFQQGWVQHLVTTFGTANNGGQKYYILDNEPSIWYGTHRDVHPTGAHDTEIRDKIEDYAARIRAVDPNATIVGPEEWGWTGYLFSGFDQQKAMWGNQPDHDQAGHGDYLPWLLTQLLRNKSTRSLWDPNYVDQSWINDKVQLIPRLKNWVSTYYPGLQTGITEYNWGAEGHINGATAQADILGIFGREGLDLAARWTYPDPSTPTYKAMKLYRNYDGNKSTFGDVSVSTTVANPDNLSAFGAQRSSDGVLTLMVINKQISTSQPVAVNLSNFSATGVASSWRLTSANSIARLADQNYSGGSFAFTAPAQSITLMVLSPTGTVPLPPPTPTGLAASVADSQVTLNWNPSSGATGYNVRRSTTSGSGYAIVANPGGTQYVDTAVTNATTYYYLVSALNTGGESANSTEASAVPNGPTFTTNGSVSKNDNRTTVTTTVKCTSSSTTGCIVDFEVYDSSNTRVYQSFVENQPFLTNGTRNYTWSWTATAPGTYTFKLGVFKAGWTTLYNWNDSVTTASFAVPAAPTNLAATPGDGQVALTWTAASGATFHNVKRSTTSGSGYSTIASIFGTSYTDRALFTNTTYFYVVSGVDGVGEGANSSQVSSAPLGPSFTVTGSVSPTSNTTGANTTVSFTVTCQTGALSNAVVDLEVFDPSGNLEARQFVTGQPFPSAGSSRGYTFVWTAPPAAGTYTLKVGVYGPNWSPNYYWNDSFKSVDVSASGTSTFTAVTTPAPPTAPKNTSISVSTLFTCTRGGVSGGVLDVEIYDDAGNVVKQMSWLATALSSGQNTTKAFNWTPTAAGTYTVKAGVFGSGWNPMYLWNASAATITVN